MKFKNDIEAQAGIKDTTGNLGSAGEVLSSTGTGVEWIAQSTVPSEKVVIYAKNTHTASIAKGTPVYITGTVGATDTVTIAPADAGNASHMPAVGLLDDTLAINAFGYVITGGFMDNITTDPIDGSTPSSNQTVYVKVGGGLTLTKPTGPTGLIQNIAKVGKVSGGNSGSLIVSSILRTNDVPNLTTGKIWVGDSNTVESTVVHLDEPNGRMGIGTTSPSYKLTVDDNTSYGGIMIQGNNAPALTLLDESGTAKNLIYAQSTASTQGNLKISADDNNTGTDSSIEFRVDNSEKMRIDSSGNVGIGATSPGAKLEVSDSTTQAGILITSDGGNEQFRIRRYSNNNEQLILGFHSSDYATIQAVEQGVAYRSLALNPNGGNVGIGTTSPGQKLHLNNSATLTPTYQKFTNGTATTGTILGIDADGDFIINNGEAKEIKLYTNDSQRVTIQSGGNVGIGTTSPAKPLHIQTNDSSYGSMRIYRDSTSIGEVSIGFFGKSNQPTNEAWVIGEGGWGNGDKFVIGNENGGAGGNVRLVIEKAGNVGIGTTSPSTKLQVYNSTEGQYMEVGAGDGGGRSLVFTSSNNNGSAGALHTINAKSVNGAIALSTAGNERMRITSDGGISFGSTGTAYGTPGQVLTSAGNAPPTWETPTTGDITAVVAGSGMTGTSLSGPIPTLNVIGGDGITANADDIQVDDTVARKYVGTATGIDNTAYKTAFTVNGGNLSSHIRFTVQGTTGSVVVSSLIDLAVNHHQDIQIKALSGNYTLLSVKVISNNNEDFEVQLKTNSANPVTLYLEVFPLGSEIVTFTSTSSFTGATGTFDDIPYGNYMSGTGGDDGDLFVGGNLTVNSGDITLSGTGRIQGVDTVSANTDAANKLYVDNAVAAVPIGDYLPLSAGLSYPLTGDLFIEGVSTPKITLTDTTNNLEGRIRVANNYMYIEADNSDAVGSTRIVLSTDGVEALRLDNNQNATFAGIIAAQGTGDSYFTGNVGIGTTSPTAKLDVVGSAEINGRLIVNQNGVNTRLNSVDANGPVLSFDNNTIAKGFVGSGYHLWVAPNNIADNFGIRAENQLDLGIGSSVKMTIDSSGNVGIGTTSPGQKLEVNGNIKLSETAATTDTDKFVVLDSGVLKYRTGTQVISDIGAQPAGTYNTIIGTDSDINTSGSTIIDNIYVTDGVITSMGTRALTVSDIGATPLDHIRSLGTQAFTNGSNPDITTSEVISEIESDGGFDSYTSVFKTSWSYAGNYNLTDAGRFTETAGSSWITWTDNSSDSTRGNITALAIAPNTGGSAGKVFIYNDQGSSYSPGWREVWTSTSDGSGSGLDADLLDGQHASEFALSSHSHTWADISGETANSVNGWGGLRHQTNDGYIDFGPANSNFAHIYTDRPSFYYNKDILVNGVVVLKGAGTTNYLSKFTGSTTLGNSLVYDNGTNVGIGTTSPGAKLSVAQPSSGDATILAGRRTGTPTIKSDSTEGGYLILDSHASAVALNHYSSNNVWLATGGGNVGIGTTAPTKKLEVAGSGIKLVNAANTHTHLLLDTATYDYKLGDISTTGGAYFQITSSTNQTYIYNSDLILSDGQQITITRSNPADPSCIYVDNTYTSFGTTYNIDSDVSSTFGSRHIGFRYNGTIVGFIGTNGTTAVTYSTSASDERLKKNIEDWQENILDKFEKIEPKEFNFISQEEGESKTKGFIAQNMAEDFPEAYPHDYSEDKYYSFNPSGMVVYLMKAVKDLVEQNKQLETRIQTLEQQKL